MAVEAMLERHEPYRSVAIDVLGRVAHEQHHGPAVGMLQLAAEQDVPGSAGSLRIARTLVGAVL